MLIEHGYGKKNWPDGAHFQGNFIDGRIHGKGVYQFANGDIYEGQWQYNKANGTGKFTHASDGATYEGEWLEDMQHG